MMMTLQASITAAQGLPSRQQLWQQDLQRQLQATELTELTSDNGSFMALQREALTSFTKGTAILVPDWSEHAASPNQLDALRQQLNDYGWHTLAIMPPNAAIFEQDPAASDYPQQLAERLLAATQQAEQQPGNIIVIAKGSSAAVLNQLYAEEQLVAPAAFVMLGAYLADHNLNRDLASHIARQRIATLDISHQRDNRFATANLKLRQQLVQRHLKAQYRQRQLTGTFYDADVHAWVLKEITGWLHSIGL
ncbi:hypothetical protein WG68_13795 [Arsukibacterium ikkense]|uniref:DUF3530 domain-containing protein n=2 Tax=Arsukibacterium ikkense TaxID=336831 RepID=A0A0M2V6Y9_9GAMM|nr:hypothetical protein WG68_13795 [Arsukibacterium ikkense]